MTVIISVNNIIDNFQLGVLFLLGKMSSIYLKSSIGLAFMCLVTYPLLYQLNKKMSWRINWQKRFAVETILFFVVLILLTLLAHATLIPNEVRSDKAQRIAILITFFMLLSCFGFFELKMSTRENLRLAVALAVSEKERIDSQLAALRQQVNPHFLFNSLNVLSSLIYEDQAKAEDFVHEFGDIYRYVLEINDEPVVTLDKELQFLDSYTFLQKIRFKEALMIKKNVDADKLNDFLPPLTLQLLLENAIKHNIISSSKPFVVEIYNEGDYLVVKNSMQPRKTKEKSFGLGLKNLEKKYDLISDRLPEQTVNDNWFVVRVPLLKSEDKE